MHQSVRILHLEDDAADAELVEAILESAGMVCRITRVQTGDAFGEALRQSEYDIILADFRLPNYDGMSALRLAQQLARDVPFIFVSGIMGEDAAIEGLTEGATDYVLKDKLSRLEPAVKRALRDAENRRERKRAEEALEKRLVALTRPLDDAAAITFEELFNLDDIQRLQDEFARATGVASIITYPDGTPITAPSSFCRLCKDVIRKTGKGLANCYRSDAVIGQSSAQGPTIQPCMSGGLWDAGSGISIGGRHVANWLIGQVRDATQTEEKLRAYAREIGADEATMIEAFREVPAMSRERFGQVAQALFTLANQLSAIAYQNVQQARFITERKQAEEALTESRNFLDKIINSVADPIFVKDRTHRSVLLNEALCNFMGYSRNELLGKSDHDFFPKHEADVFWQKDEDVFNAGVENISEEELTDAKGAVHTIVTKKTLYTDEKGEQFIVGIIRDMTEYKNLEEQLRQAVKLEAIGVLAGGVAHDFNNLLTAVMGYSEIGLHKIAKDDPLRKDIEQIRKAGERAAALTSQLLAFSRKQVVQLKVLDLNQVIAETESMLRRLIGEDIDLVSAPYPALARVLADPGLVGQVIMNLAINARDAMPRGGKLTIETANVYLGQAYARQHLGVEPGPHVMLAVSDTGSGMDEMTLSRIFEPFFTTKQKGKGTGLGLAVVYGIVKQSGGHIWVYSEPGRGTVFKVYLPCAEQETESPDLGSGPAEPRWRGSEAILVVEDDDTVRDLAGISLRMYGYTVLEARDGYHALKVCEEHEGPFQLLVTDVVMPGISGRELAQKIEALRPAIKVLYISGYTDNAIVHHGILDAGMAFLQKPFTPEALARKVREVLDEPDNAP